VRADGAFSPQHEPIMALTIGEVHTGLLLTSSALPTEAAAALLAIVPGDFVRSRQRPVRYAWSPDVLTGVDCQAPSDGHREVRLVGTPATRLFLTDGHIVQAATHAAVQPEPGGQRRPWAHYLTRPGVLEALGGAADDHLAVGFLAGRGRQSAALDLGAVNARALAAIQRSDRLDHRPPFRSRRTRLRWSAETGPGEELVFTLGADGLRTVRLRTGVTSPRALADFCADLALHDWMLSALLDLVDKAMSRSRPAAELIRLLRPGIDHLVHAWMPAAHLDRSLIGVWQEFDRRAGLSLQWEKTVGRIRDQLSVGIIEALQPLTEPRRSEPA
jgi:hypothetical protein